MAPRRRLEERGDAAGRRGEEPEPPKPGPSLLDLQRSAGNAAVSNLIQRALVRDAARRVTDVEFTVGQEISLTLATKAQQLAVNGVNDADLNTLRADALGDETIGDDERMFLAGLLYPPNARQVASARIAAGVKFTFTRASIEAHYPHVRDLGQQAKDPTIAAEHQAAQAAQASGDFAGYFAHENEAIKATFLQIAQLAGPAWQAKALDAASWGVPTVPPEQVLEAMLAAASDDTPGDRAMAAVVYAIAAEAGHPMAPMVRSGKIQIDQVASLAGGDWAAYRPTAGVGRKGDTVYVPTALNVHDLAHRSVVIHELTHAGQDAAATGTTVQMTARDRAEMEAYRAGARYQLERTAPLTWVARLVAVQEIANLLNEIGMMTLVLESRARPREYEKVIEEVNGFWRHRLTSVQLARLLQARDVDIERACYTTIRRSYGAEDAQGRRIPGGNDLPIDQLSGESVLDWVDRV